MMNKTVWTYNPDTKEVCLQINCQPNPLVKGEFITPENHVTFPPLPLKEHYTVVINADLTAWEYEADNSGTWYDSERAEHQVEDKTSPVDNTWTREPLPLTDAEVLNKSVNQYKQDRAAAYPSMADQLDDIYHNGVEGWKATIQAVKDTYPKGGN